MQDDPTKTCPGPGSPIPEDATPDRKSASGSRRLAIMAMAGAAVGFALMGVFAKMAGPGLSRRPLPSAEVAFLRFLFGFLTMLPLHGRRGINLWGRDRWGLFWRGLSGAGAIMLYFFAIQHTTLTHAVLLNYTFVVFAPPLAWLFLNERLAPRGVLAVLLAIMGTIIVMHPRWDGARIGDLFGLASGVLAGVAVVMVRKLRTSESSVAIFFYLCLVGTPAALLWAFFQGMRWPDGLGWLLAFGMGAAATAGQLLMTYSYRYLGTTEGNLVMLTNVPYAAVFGTLFFAERLTVGTVVGGLLILAACVLMT